jgi:hypothetical protein
VRSVTGVILFGAISCGCNEPAATLPVAPTPSATAARGGRASAYVGDWSSERCGIRKYERVVRLLPDGKLETQDRFNTCPPNETCEGSGVGIMRGVYRVADRREDPQCPVKEGVCIWLETDEASRHDPATDAIPQYPAFLAFDTVPYESDGEGTVCRYKRVP